MSDQCACGHVRDEHYSSDQPDPKYPGSRSCTIKDCECIHFEETEDDEEIDD